MLPGRPPVPLSSHTFFGTTLLGTVHESGTQWMAFEGFEGFEGYEGYEDD